MLVYAFTTLRGQNASVLHLTLDFRLLARTRSMSEFGWLDLG